MLVGATALASVLINPLKVSPIEQISAMWASLAVIFAFFSLVFQTAEGNANDKRYERALGLRQFDENEKPLLKGLIKIKTKNYEFSLEQIYKINKEMFTNEKLIERLYE